MNALGNPEIYDILKIIQIHVHSTTSLICLIFEYSVGPIIGVMLRIRNMDSVQVYSMHLQSKPIPIILKENLNQWPYMYNIHASPRFALWEHQIQQTPIYLLNTRAASLNILHIIKPTFESSIY